MEFGAVHIMRPSPRAIDIDLFLPRSLFPFTNTFRGVSMGEKKDKKRKEPPTEDVEMEDAEIPSVGRP